MHDLIGDIHGHAGGANAVVGKMVQRVVEVLAGLQQSLGGNTTDIGTSATGRGAAFGVFPFINASDLKTQLGRADRCDIAAGSSADDDDVKFCAHGVRLLNVKQEA